MSYLTTTILINFFNQCINLQWTLDDLDAGGSPVQALLHKPPALPDIHPERCGRHQCDSQMRRFNQGVCILFYYVCSGGVNEAKDSLAPSIPLPTRAWVQR